MADTDAIRELIQAGELTAASEAAMAAVKKSPGDGPLRGLLFETLCVAGEYERAQKHLNVLASSSGPQPPTAKMYHGCLKAEVARQQVFNEGRVPEVITEPTDVFKAHISALTAAREGDAAGAAAALDGRDEGLVQAVHHGEGAYGRFRDADDVLGPFIEYLTTDGRYFWVDPAGLASMSPMPVASWMDTIWRPVALTLAEGGMMTGCIPAVYFGSDTDAAKMGRMTDFQPVGDAADDEDGVFRGVGQRLFWFDDEEVPVLEMKAVRFAADEFADGDEADDAAVPGVNLTAGLTADADSEGDE